jgi:riboflavin biosynthesis pyrimidine reductase
MTMTAMPDAKATSTDDWRIDRLFEAPTPDGRARGGPLPADLARRYGADLAIPLRADRPTVVSNFVSTIDGVVAFDTEGRTGGQEVSGASTPDRFLMGLLRATADAVLNGAGTVRSGAHHRWSPAYVYPPAAEAYAAWRRDLGLVAAAPTTVIVSASGSIDPGHPGLRDPDVPVVIITTPAGATRLRAAGLPATVDVVTAGSGDEVEPPAIVEVLRERGLEVVVCEGGPTLLGGLIGAGLVDELFLTVAPQVAGRSPDVPRLALVEGVAFAIDDAPWTRLVSVMRAESHLFLRYRVT